MDRKLFGLILSAFAVIQGYLWIFGVIELRTMESGFYLVMLCGQFVFGLLAAKIIVSRG